MGTVTVCASCHGSGHNPMTDACCPDCDGVGAFPIVEPQCERCGERVLVVHPSGRAICAGCWSGGRDDGEPPHDR